MLEILYIIIILLLCGSIFILVIVKNSIDKEVEDETMSNSYNTKRGKMSKYSKKDYDIGSVARAEILDMIEGLWNEVPELRLSQLIANATEKREDIFYISDKELIDTMQYFIKTIKRKRK